jgi:hypothetical protein
MVLPGKLIIFDYSGTLSPAMAEFAKPDNLMHHLQESGLFALGVESVTLFWEIINATWTKGSTTKAGYKKVLQDQICQLFPEAARSKKREVANAVADFADAYFKHSYIDDYWRPVLEMINNNKSVQVIIATDHYAEATDTIINYFGKWKIQAIAANTGIDCNYLVANSADIGAHKAERKFWETVQTNCLIRANQILLVDDFGANEQRADAYAQPHMISERRQKTVDLLENVFSAQVEYFLFAAPELSVADLVTQASIEISQFINDNRRYK